MIFPDLSAGTWPLKKMRPGTFVAWADPFPIKIMEVSDQIGYRHPQLVEERKMVGTHREALHDWGGFPQ